jgi:hypothetical protein
MIQDIRKSTFKAKVHSLREMKCLGQSSGDRRGAGAFQDTYAAISHRTGGNRIEGVDVEHTAGCRICDIPVADAIRPLKGAAIGEVQVSRIVVRARRGREIGPGLPQADGAEGPSAEGEVGGMADRRDLTETIHAALSACFPSNYAAVFMNSLWIVQDFLTIVSLW